MALKRIVNRLAIRKLPSDVEIKQMTISLKKDDNPLGITVYEMPKWQWKNQHGRVEFWMTETNHRCLVRRLMQMWGPVADGLKEPDMAENLDIWCHWLVCGALNSHNKAGEPWHNSPQDFADRLFALTKYNIRTDTEGKVFTPPGVYEGYFRTKPWAKDLKVVREGANKGGRPKKTPKKGGKKTKKKIDDIPADKVYRRMSEEEVQEKVEQYCKEAGVTQSYDIGSFELLVRLEDDLLYMTRVGEYDADEYAKKHNLLNQVRDKLGLKRKQHDESSQIEFGSIGQAIELFDAVIDTGLFQGLEEAWAVEEAKMLVRKNDRKLPNGDPEIDDLHTLALFNQSQEDIRQWLKEKGTDPYDPPDPKIKQLEEEVAQAATAVIQGTAVKKKYSEAEFVVKTARFVWYVRKNAIGAAFLLFGLLLRAPHQRLCVRTIFQYRNVILKLSRGMSKTFMLGLCANLKTLPYKYATGLVLGQGLRQGQLILEESMEPQIMGTLEGQQKRGFALKAVRNSSRIIEREKDLYRIRYGATYNSRTATGPLGKQGANSPLRGLRANSFLFCDESADIGQDVWTSVIRPFRNVTSGFGREHSLSLQPFTNIEAGTVRYEWQRYTQSILEHEKRMAEGSTDHVVIEFNYEDAFFVDTTGRLIYLYPVNKEEIEADKNEGLEDEATWLAENKNILIAQSDTEYPSQLIEKVRNFKVEDEAGERWLKPLLSTPDPVIIGIDPAREYDEFALVVLHVGQLSTIEEPVPYDRVIYAKTLRRKTFQEMANEIWDTLERFPNCLKVVMDQGGGGSALRDLLLQPVDENRVPVYDPDAYDAQNPIPEEIEEHGKGILKMVAPNAEWNTINNNFVKGRMEKELLLLPKHEYRHPDPEMKEALNATFRLGNQFTTIVSRPLGRYKNYDTKSKHLKKDLYSATILANSERYTMLQNEMRRRGKRKVTTMAVAVRTR